MIFDFFTTHDNLLIRYGFLPCPRSRGTVIFLNGRSEFMEKHFETVHELNRRRFAVFSLDWRGQGLSSRMLANPHKGFVASYEDYIRDLRLFMTRIVRNAAGGSPLIFLCHSMGGHIGFRYLHDFPGEITCAVQVSPMFEIRTFPFPLIFSKWLTLTAVRRGYAHAYALTQKNFRPPDRINFRWNPLTQDFERFMDEKRAVDKNPRLALGGVTYGWLQATFDSADILMSPGYGKQVQTPVLILSAERDRVVSVHAQKKFCTALPQCRFKMISGSYHEILKEREPIRAAFWAEFDCFVYEKT
ncbi:MAG: alpha/beta fold hydrolase [Desulfococcaceae bacterium]